jgi:hypothetical protein
MMRLEPGRLFVPLLYFDLMVADLDLRFNSTGIKLVAEREQFLLKFAGKCA